MKIFYKTIFILFFPLLTLQINFVNGQVGMLDNTFGINGEVITNFQKYDYLQSMAIQPDGKIILTGVTDTGSLASNFMTIRYNIDGDIDSTFGVNGIDTADLNQYLDKAYAVLVQPDGKIIVTGVTYTTSSSWFGTVRYNSDGTLDTTFGIGGKVTTQFGILISSATAYTVALQSNGKIIVGGLCSNNPTDFAMVRYNSNGSLDTSFGNMGFVITDISGSTDDGYDIILQPDGKILFSGYSGGPGGGFTVARYNTNGSLDSSFNNNGIVVDSAAGWRTFDLALQTDGKIILGGYSWYQGDFCFALARYLPDGSPDSTFGTTGRIINTNNIATGQCTSVIIQPDGKILAAGASSYCNCFTTIRYNSNGTIDSTFALNGISNIYIASHTAKACLQPNGKIVVAGWVSTTTGVVDFGMIRLNNDLFSGLNEVEQKNDFFLIYPNPTNTTLNLSLNRKENIVVTNLIGELILHQFGEGKVELDVSTLSGGIYFIKAGNEVRKFVKE